MKLSWLIPSTLVLCGFLPPLTCSLVCSDRVYGNPKVDDCKQALLEIPFARQPKDSLQSRLPHVFAEPQFLRPPFRLLTNAFPPQSTIQLPKIWKHNSCRIALMSQGLSDTTEVVSPQFSATWKDIISQSAPLRRCLAFVPPRGGWIPFQLTAQDPAATLYMYDSDSAFSIVMNSYMSDGIPISPISNDVGLDMPGNATPNALALDLVKNLTRTLSTSHDQSQLGKGSSAPNDS